MWKLAACVGLVVVAACARHPQDIRASSYPSSALEGIECPDLKKRLDIKEYELTQVSEVQTTAWRRDKIGVALLGLPIGSMGVGDEKAKISGLKGEIAAITNKIKRDCQNAKTE
jgi:hypothetical protein